MLVSRTAAPSSVANWSGVCRCAMWVKPSSGMFVPYGGDTGASSYFLSLLCYGPSRRSNEATGCPLASHPRACNVGSFASRSRGRLTLLEFTSRFDPLVAVSSRSELERLSVALLQNEIPVPKPVRLLEVSLSSLEPTTRSRLNWTYRFEHADGARWAAARPNKDNVLHSRNILSQNATIDRHGMTDHETRGRAT